MNALFCAEARRRMVVLGGQVLEIEQVHPELRSLSVIYRMVVGTIDFIDQIVELGEGDNDELVRRRCEITTETVACELDAVIGQLPPPRPMLRVIGEPPPIELRELEAMNMVPPPLHWRAPRPRALVVISVLAMVAAAALAAAAVFAGCETGALEPMRPLPPATSTCPAIWQSIDCHEDDAGGVPLVSCSDGEGWPIDDCNVVEVGFTYGHCVRSCPR